MVSKALVPTKLNIYIYNWNIGQSTEVCRNWWERWTKCNRHSLSTLRCCFCSHINLCIFSAQKKEFPLSGTHQRKTRVYFRFMNTNSRRECERSLCMRRYCLVHLNVGAIWYNFFRCGKTVRLGYIYCRARCASENQKKDKRTSTFICI